MVTARNFLRYDERNGRDKVRVSANSHTIRKYAVVF